ncbi:MAG: BamA/TamA family outer membrane protein [Capsulimonadales bacterium]|nr:BamA/TamA family outer membrane protein [Capsulimonadales bacterium]
MPLSFAPAANSARRSVLRLLLLPVIGGIANGAGARTIAPGFQEPAPPLLRVTEVRFTGNRVLSTDDLIRAIRETLSDPKSDAGVRAIVEAVRGVYRAKGYVMAQVTDAETEPDGTLRLTIAEGNIRKVIIRGNTRTRTQTIRRAIAIGEGDVYNETAIRNERLRLSRLGIFADISIAPRVPGGPTEENPNDPDADPTSPPANPTSSPADPPVVPPSAEPTESAAAPVPAGPLVPSADVGEIDLVVRVRDQPTVNVAATVGYTDNIGAVGFLDLSENNLLGTGHRIGVEWQRTAQTQIASDGTLRATNSRFAAGFSYEIPTLGQNSLGVGIQFYNRNTVFLPFFAGGRETVRSYERRSGVRGRLGRRFAGNWEGFVTARRDLVGYDAVPTDLNPPIEALRTSAGTVGAVGIDLIADGRDSAETPSRGYRHELIAERAGAVFGGNRAFTQLTLDLRQYTPVLSPPPRRSGSGTVPGPVFALRLLGGYSQGDVPLSEQFFLGGFDLLRGYDLFSIRGDRFALSTAELRIPIGSGLQAVAFSDLGQAWEPGQSVGFNDLKGSVGLGLRFFSPFGPIRLDAAYGSRLQTYVSLGQSF